MAKKNFLTLLPIYAVFVNGDFIFASEEEEDCEGYIEFLHQKDLEFIKEEYDVDVEEDPAKANYLAGRYGDASSAKIVCISEYDVDDDGEFEYEESTYTVYELENLIKSREEEEDIFTDEDD